MPAVIPKTPKLYAKPPAADAEVVDLSCWVVNVTPNFSQSSTEYSTFCGTETVLGTPVESVSVALAWAPELATALDDLIGVADVVWEWRPNSADTKVFHAVGRVDGYAKPAMSLDQRMETEMTIGVTGAIDFATPSLTPPAVAP